MKIKIQVFTLKFIKGNPCSLNEYTVTISFVIIAGLDGLPGEVLITNSKTILYAKTSHLLQFLCVAE